MNKNAITAQAPGRFNLIGEHTDYNGGFVLPVAIPQTTKVTLTRRTDDQVTVKSSNITVGTARVAYRLGQETRQGLWSDYVQGVTSVLLKEGHKLTGFDAEISSTVPMGSGLSSSAALEISLLRALRLAYDLHLDDVALALLGQRVENEFVGARVGVMDQMASSLLAFGEALFLDCQSLRYERVRLPLEKLGFLVINSGISHSHSTGDYNTRRTECEQACELLNRRSLRDVHLDELDRVQTKLPEKLFKRVRHVVTENDRVLQAVNALRSGNARQLGKLFVESHASMSQDYQVSTSKVDELVNIACSAPGVFGARMTGGGFGGSIVVVTPPDNRQGNLRALAEDIVREYERRCKEHATILLP